MWYIDVDIWSYVYGVVRIEMGKICKFYGVVGCGKRVVVNLVSFSCIELFLEVVVVCCFYVNILVVMVFLWLIF